MNVTKFFSIVFLFSSFLAFSQNKIDAYFILDTKNEEYIISYGSDKVAKGTVIYLQNRKQYLNSQKKKHVWVNVSTFLISEIDTIYYSKNNSLKYLFLVDYSWVLRNAWKPLCNTCPYDFKNIYFLKHIKDCKYIKYKVEEVVTEY